MTYIKAVIDSGGRVLHILRQRQITSDNEYIKYIPLPTNLEPVSGETEPDLYPSIGKEPHQT